MAKLRMLKKRQQLNRIWRISRFQILELELMVTLVLMSQEQVLRVKPT